MPSNLKPNTINKRAACKRPLRERYKHLAKTGRPRTERGEAIRDFAKAYPCHIERARAVANGRDKAPAICAAWRDFAAARGVPVNKPGPVAPDAKPALGAPGTEKPLDGGGCG